RETRVRGAAQQAIELLDLSPLALPSHPEPFARVPLSKTMKQKEAIRASPRIFGVECRDPRTCCVKNLRVVRQRFGLRIGEVAEDGEVDVRVDVTERLDFEVRHQIG